MRNQRLILTILVVALAMAVTEVLRLRGIIGRTHLAFAVFRVEDAETKAPISDFVLTFPELPGHPDITFFPRQLSFFRGPEFSLVAGVAMQPLAFSVRKDGYLDASFEINPKNYSTYYQFLPGEVRTILLKKIQNL